MSRTVLFQVHFESQFGQNIFLAGSCPELGEFDEKAAKQLEWTNGHFWRLSITIPNVPIEYQFYMKKGNDISTWEGIRNRILPPDTTETHDEFREGPKIQEIPIGTTVIGRLFRCPMPFSVFDPTRSVISEMKSLGVDTVVCLTHHGEYLRYGVNLSELYREHGLAMVHYAINDFHAPDDMPSFHRLVIRVIDLLQNGRKIAVHCHAGIGRTGILIGCLAQVLLGMDPQRIIRWIRQYIPGAVQTGQQRHFVEHFPLPRRPPLSETAK